MSIEQSSEAAVSLLTTLGSPAMQVAMKPDSFTRIVSHDHKRLFSGLYMSSKDLGTGMRRNATLTYIWYCGCTPCNTWSDSDRDL